MNLDSFTEEQFRSHILYLATNEVVEAVVRGLDVTSQDRVLTVCGSGDVPFGMVERGAEVVALDINGLQVEYARWRLQKLGLHDLHSFFQFFDCGRGEKNTVNREYFSVQGKLSTICENASKMEFGVGDILRQQRGEFTKIYLSNVLGSGVERLPAQIYEDFVSVSTLLVEGGLLYVTQDRFYGKPRFCDIPRGLEEDVEQTCQARRYERFWVNPGPTVFRKMIV